VRVAAFAYHQVGYAGLLALERLGVEVPVLFTHEDDPREKRWYCSCADWARERGIPVRTPADPRDPAVESDLCAARPDALVSLYYRRILPRRLLEVPPRGGLNLHGSLLPRYRGRCPVNWVLVNGESETGVTLHAMTPRADQGPIVAQRRIAIDPRETAPTLYRKVVEAGEQVLLDSFLPWARGETRPVPQDESRATKFGGRRPEDGRFEWTWPARRIDRLVRAVTRPWPGAFFERDGRRFLVWEGEPAPGAAPPGVAAGLREAGVLMGTGEGLYLVRSGQWEGEREAPVATLLGAGAEARST
jgi:UDP-4-amino-4-deoxy-L-arabinose formyltransferase/UDP-glucuronic acid dehydrogenase (UDP-4-keto-hexauronic acid decarboxylating)